jgi:CDP-6-deoxy-D-xylo-4-hexulose-3-dehydrase
VAAIGRVVNSGMHTMGLEVRHFESEFAEHFGSRFAVMSNSGSSANLLAVAAIRYAREFNPEKNEVIVPAVSWSTTYYPLHQNGFKLRFVDIDINTLNASVEAVEEAINERTAGIFAVSLLGNPSDLEGYSELAQKYGLFLLEDNCESMGASVGGKFTGTFGAVGTFSSYFSHHISTIEGGVCLTDDVELFEHMVSLRAHGWLRDLPLENSVFNKTGIDFEDSFRFALPGWNLRPIEIEGAIGREQIKKLDNILSVREKNAQVFKDSIRGVADIVTQSEKFGKSSWFGFSIVLRGKLEGKRHQLVDLFRDNGIESRPIVAGNFSQNPVIHYLNHSPIGPMPNADIVHESGLFIGNHAYDLSDQIQLATSLIADFQRRP